MGGRDSSRGGSLGGVASDHLGAFCPGDRVEVGGAADGPLAGLRFAAKDNFDVAGHVSGAGNPDWLRTHAAADETAPAVQRLLDAGADLIGKTVMDELAFGSVGENRHYGTPVNSAAPGRVPGGSSSGSASAVAGGLVDFALGTDSACSVRLPASVCGLYGMRPTHGRVPLDGVIPLSPSLDTVGWLCRTSSCLQRVGNALLDPGPLVAEPARLRIVDDAFALAREPIRAALAPAVDHLCSMLCENDHVNVGEPETERALGLFLMHSYGVQIREVWECHGAWIKETRPDSVVLTAETLRLGAESTDLELRAARETWDLLRVRIRELVPPDCVLCLPTVTDVPPRCAAPDDERGAFTIPSLCLLSIAVLAGLPQLSIPGATDAGLPVGLSLIGAPGSDERLLDLACRLADGPSV